MGINWLQKSEFCAMDIIMYMALRLGRFFLVSKVIWLMLLFCTLKWHIWESLMSCFVILKVVTCGNVPLESSFRKVPRCVYTSTSLYEYRGWDSKPANSTHRRFTWGLRSSEVSNRKYYLYSRIGSS